MKLRWWNAVEPLVVDVPWEPIGDSGLATLLLEGSCCCPSGLKVVFCNFLSAAPDHCAIWVLGLMRRDELLTPISKAIMLGR